MQILNDNLADPFGSSRLADPMAPADAFGHAAKQGFDQIGHVTAPDRLCRPRNLESLARENLFQPVQRQVVPIMWCTT